jgi:hypothetical protein
MLPYFPPSHPKGDGKSREGRNSKQKRHQEAEVPKSVELMKKEKQDMANPVPILNDYQDEPEGTGP